MFLRRALNFDKKGKYLQSIELLSNAVYNSKNDTFYELRGNKILAKNQKGITHDTIDTFDLSPYKSELSISSYMHGDFLYYEISGYTKKNKLEFKLIRYNTITHKKHTIYNKDIPNLRVSYKTVFGHFQENVIVYNNNLKMAFKISPEGRVEESALQFIGPDVYKDMYRLNSFSVTETYVITEYALGHLKNFINIANRDEAIPQRNIEYKYEGRKLANAIKDDIYNSGYLKITPLNVDGVFYSINSKEYFDGINYNNPLKNINFLLFEMY